MLQSRSNFMFAAPRPLVLAGAVGLLLLTATVALWAHYGSTVFYEMVRSGLAACF